MHCFLQHELQFVGSTIHDHTTTQLHNYTTAMILENNTWAHVDMEFLPEFWARYLVEFTKVEQEKINSISTSSLVLYNYINILIRKIFEHFPKMSVVYRKPPK